MVYANVYAEVNLRDIDDATLIEEIENRGFNVEEYQSSSLSEEFYEKLFQVYRNGGDIRNLMNDLFMAKLGRFV